MSRRTHPTVLRVDLAPAAQLGRRRPNRVHGALWAVARGDRRITGWAGLCLRTARPPTVTGQRVQRARQLHLRGCEPLL